MLTVCWLLSVYPPTPPQPFLALPLGPKRLLALWLPADFGDAGRSEGRKKEGSPTHLSHYAPLPDHGFYSGCVPFCCLPQLQLSRDQECHIPLLLQVCMCLCMFLGFTIPCGVLNLNKLKSLPAIYPLSMVPVLIQVPLSNERLQTSCFLQDLDRDKWKNTLA